MTFLFTAVIGFLAGILGAMIFTSVHETEKISSSWVFDKNEDKSARLAIQMLAKKMGGSVHFYSTLPPSVFGAYKLTEENIERHEDIMRALFVHLKLEYSPSHEAPGFIKKLTRKVAH